MKKVLSIVLCVLILVSAMTMLAYAKSYNTVCVEINEPVAGETPDFNPEITTSGNFEIGGVYWSDESDSGEMCADDEFAPGHTYQVSVYILMKEESSDTFTDDVKLYINGTACEMVGHSEDYVEGYVYFETEPEDPNALKIVNVEIDGSIAALELVPFSVLLMGDATALDKNYNSSGYVNGVRWKSDKRTSYYAKGDRFDANSVNTVEVRLKATGSYYFADNVVGRINFMDNCTSTVSNNGKTLVIKYKLSKLQKLKAGWHKSEDGKKFYIKSDGTPYTSKLISVSNVKYYVGKDGAVYTSKLISVDGKKYYVGKDGAAYKSKLISVDGKKYYIGSDCVAYKSKFASLDGKKYYFGSDCVMIKSKLISVDGKKYYMGKDGVAYKSKLISVSGKKYYIGKDCVAYKSKFASLSGKKYYFGSDCVMYKSKTFSVSGVKWKADSNGVCKKV